MADRVFQMERGASWRRRAILATLASLAGLAAVMLAPARSEAACAPAQGGEYDFLCTTDSHGTATLVVPKGELIAAFEPAFIPLEDCIWPEVQVDFGDGTNKTYEWDASVGLTASHTFPEPGQYVVLVDTGEGTHSTPPNQPCPQLTLSALATYPEPKPEEPPKEEPGGEEPPPSGGGNGLGGVPEVVTMPAPGELPLGAAPQRAFWRACAGEVLAHRVTCKRAHEVVQVALARLRGGRLRGRHTESVGFSCTVRRRGPKRLACRRQARRILAPLGS